MIRHLRPGGVVAALGWAGIALATLRNAPESGMPHSMLCVVCGPIGGADVIQNILLFLPLGIGLGTTRASGTRAMALVIATTIAVELIQATVLTGRFASLGDVLANSAGGAIGYWVGRRHMQWAFPSPRTRRALARSSVLAAVLMLVAATAGIRRAVPPERLALEIAPMEDHGRWFQGSVATSSLGGEPIPAGPLPPAIESNFRRYGGALSLTVVSVPWVEYESTIAAIVDPHSRGAVRVSQDGRNAVLVVRVAGSLARLRGPRLVLPAALPPRADERVWIVADATMRRVALTVRAGDRTVTRALAMGPSTAWLVLYPFGYRTTTMVAVVSFAWLAILLVPAGYWSGLTRVGTPSAGALREHSPVAPRELAANVLCVAMHAIIGLWIAPLALGFAAAPTEFWLAPLVGFACGVAAGRLASRVAA